MIERLVYYELNRLGTLMLTYLQLRDVSHQNIQLDVCKHCEVGSTKSLWHLLVRYLCLP